MALTIIEEDGTAKTDANSFVTLAEVDAYAESSLTAAKWIAEADDEIKKAAIISASRNLTTSIRWKGVRKTDDQALAWPREEVEVDGVEIADDLVPKAVKDATAEMAIRLHEGAGTVGVSPEAANLKSMNVGKGAVNFSFHGKQATQIVPDFVGHMLSGYGEIKTGSTTSGFSIRKAGR